MIASKKETFELLKKHNLIANKKFGQNFLINYETIKKIVSQSEITPNSLVIEIGPGLGALTQELLNISKQVIAIEIDKKMIKVLQENFTNQENLKIINEDFLKIDLNNLIEQYSKYQEVIIISNLPYYITSDILEKIISLKNKKITKIVTMMQKEVGKKLLKKEDKIESYLKVLIDNYCTVNTIMHVSKNDFEPRPKVDSIVLKININNDKYLLDDYFYKIIKECFKGKRKTLLNTLPYDKEKIKEIFKQLDIKETVRIDEITIKQLKDIIERSK